MNLQYGDSIADKFFPMGKETGLKDRNDKELYVGQYVKMRGCSVSIGVIGESYNKTCSQYSLYFATNRASVERYLDKDTLKRIELIEDQKQAAKDIVKELEPQHRSCIIYNIEQGIKAFKSTKEIAELVDQLQSLTKDIEDYIGKSLSPQWKHVFYNICMNNAKYYLNHIQDDEGMYYLVESPTLLPIDTQILSDNLFDEEEVYWQYRLALWNTGYNIVEEGVDYYGITLDKTATHDNIKFSLQELHGEVPTKTLMKLVLQHMGYTYDTGVFTKNGRSKW